MPRFPEALAAWQSDVFGRVLKEEIESLSPGTLPLHLGTAQGGFVDDSDIAATVLTSAEEAGSICADVGIFFTEIVGGCSCGDEPEAVNAYCRLRIHIDKSSAEARIGHVLD
jgi:hypothetical protein